MHESRELSYENFESPNTHWPIFINSINFGLSPDPPIPHHPLPSPHEGNHRATMPSDLKSNLKLVSKAEAARANGTKSRGPATPEGRAKSSRNSLRHGLSAKSVLLPAESHEQFQLLLDAPTSNNSSTPPTLSRWIWSRPWPSPAGACVASGPSKPACSAHELERRAEGIWTRNSTEHDRRRSPRLGLSEGRRQQPEPLSPRPLRGQPQSRLRPRV